MFGLGVVLAAAVGAVYANSWNAPFVLDDAGSIVGNPTIRHLWPLHDVLHPPADAGVGGRPLANLTLALNYASGGLAPRGYHVVNTLIHAANAWLLFGIARRTLLRRAAAGDLRQERRAVAMAFWAATLWAVHPLATAGVTYVSQRTESLMALFYLTTLYAFIRGVTAKSIVWSALSVGACACGMATKEVMVTAPLVVFLYDAVFVSGSWREAWRNHRTTHLLRACTWFGLALLFADVHARGVGYGLGVTPLQYALTQCGAVLEYLQLAAWPAPLIFDRGAQWAGGLGAIWPSVAAIALLVAAVLALFLRRPGLAFVGLTFFVLLAPSSSVVPIVRQPIAENRMYLPLATVTIGIVLALDAVRLRTWRPYALLALGLATLTVRRNADFRTSEALWTDTVAKRPENARAHDWLGLAYLERGDMGAAVRSLRAAVQRAPAEAQIRNNLGLALAMHGNVAAAIEQYEEAVRLEPNLATAHSSLGYLLFRQGRREEALVELQTAIRLNPALAEAHNHLGLMLPDTDAVASFETALRLRPDFPEAHNNLAAVLFRLGRRDEALAHFEAAVRLKPDYADALTNLARAKAAIERSGERRR